MSACAESDEFDRAIAMPPKFDDVAFILSAKDASVGGICLAGHLKSVFGVKIR